MPKPLPIFLKKASSDYSYVNARVRGMNSRLLTPQQFEELMAATEIEDVTEVLENSHFSRHFQLLGPQPSAAALEDLIRRDLFEDVQALRALVDGRPRELLDTVLLYWDMEAIRTLLRGKNSNQPPDEILSSTLPIGRLSEPLIRELTKTQDLRSLVEILYTWKFPFSRPLMKALISFEPHGRFVDLEHALEKEFFEEADRTLGAIGTSETALRTFFDDLKDLFNIRCALRVRDSGISPDRAISYFLGKGQRAGKSLFLLIVQQDSAQAACSIAAANLGLEEKPKDELALERVLEHRLFQIGMSAYLGDPLSFDVVLGYLWNKIAEIRNARIIIKGRLAAIRPERIEEELLN